MNAHGSSFPASVDAGIPRLGECPENWRKVKIGELFEQVSRPVVMADDETYDLVTVGRARSGIRFRSRSLGSEIAVKSQFELAEGDFLISKRQVSHGAIGVVSAEFAGSIVSNEYSVLRPTEQLSLRYFWWFAHSRYIQQTLFHSSIGVHVEKLIFKLKDWFAWEVHLPPLQEQRKVAAFLDAVGERIALAERRRDGLVDYKRGLMQALFSRRLRFRRDDGTAFPEWVPTTVGSLGKFYGGGTPSTDDPSSWNGSTPWISSSDIDDGTVRLRVPQRHISERAIEESAAQRVPPGSVVIVTRVGIGKVAITPVELCTSQDFTSVSLSRTNAIFFATWILSSAHKLKRLAQGTSIQGVPVSDLRAMSIDLPHPDEQRKIAEAFSALDDRITAANARLDALKEWRRGLLQKMFVR